MNKKVGDCDKQIFSGANFLGITQNFPKLVSTIIQWTYNNRTSLQTDGFLNVVILSTVTFWVL